MEYAIRVVNLHKNYPKDKGLIETFLFPFRQHYLKAIDGVSFKVKNGMIFGLLGPNGAGKTTLIKTIASLLLPDAGRVYVNGFDVVKQEKKIKNLIGFVHSEERSFFWRLTGRQNLEFFASLDGLDKNKVKERVNQVLATVDMLEFADKLFNSYSTGMRRRLSFARGLLKDPKVLLIDEFTAGVDPLAALKLRRFLREFVDKTGKTVLVSTHDLREAESICDEVSILNNGKLLADGNLSQLRNKIGFEKIILKLKTDSKTIEKIKKLSGVVDFKITDTNLELKVRNSQKVLPNLIHLISKSNGKIYDCKTSQVKLDDIFEKVVGR